MKFPIYEKIQFMFQTTSQMIIAYILQHGQEKTMMNHGWVQFFGDVYFDTSPLGGSNINHFSIR